MHDRAPHGRVAFGLGRLRAAGPAGSPVVCRLPRRRPRCRGRRRLLLLGEEEAAAAAGGGGCCCCCWRRRMLLLGEEAVIRCCVGAASLECCRLPAAVVVVVRSMRGPAARVRACQSGWGWMRARPVRRFVYTYSQCAVLGPGPGGAGRPFSVPLLERGYALFAEPAGGTRSGGTCQSQSCHHPSGAMPSSPDSEGGRRSH